MCDLLPLLWSANAKIRFVAVALVSKWCPNAKMYDLLPLLWFRSGAPMLVFRDLLPLLWFRSGAPIRKMYDLLPLLWFSKWFFQC